MGRRGVVRGTGRRASNPCLPDRLALLVISDSLLDVRQSESRACVAHPTQDQLLQQATEAKKGTGGLFARFRRTQTAKGGPGVSGPQPSSVSMSRDSSAPMHLG